MPEKNVEHWTRVNADFTDAEARRAWAEHEFSWGNWARPDAELGILGDFPLVQAFAEDVPLPDASFDLAHSEYGASLFADPYRWIPEAHRLLRPGGRLVFIRGGPLVILCAGEDGITEQLQRPLRGLNRFDSPARATSSGSRTASCSGSCAEPAST